MGEIKNAVTNTRGRAPIFMHTRCCVPVLPDDTIASNRVNNGNPSSLGQPSFQMIRFSRNRIDDNLKERCILQFAGRASDA